MDLLELRGTSCARHPWEEMRARFFIRVLETARVPSRGDTVLDVGAGDGWFARELSARFPGLAGVVCWDSGYSREMLAAHPVAASPPIRFSRERPHQAFSMLLLLDVLEHVEDDAGFLASIVRGSLATGGHALVSVPAYPSLFGSYDDRLRHHRRYSPAEARSLVNRSGLQVVRSGGLFSSLLAVRAVQVACERLAGRATPLPDAGQWQARPAVTSLIRGVLSCDAGVCLAASRLGMAIPGLSWWALCRKTSP